MATAKEPPVIISPRSKRRGKEIVRELFNEPLISVDCEGVNLSKEGPLTLLQIGTLSGRVYLFDVMFDENEQDHKFFKDTLLDKLLSSTEIVKVFHSCSGDSAALFHQFGVRLENVFDTQIAHLVIEEHKGRKLPSRLKLADLCVKYAEEAVVYEGKDDMKMEWTKVSGNFWAKRPMTDKMIEYASCDVTALIPEVYQAQKKYIDENNLTDVYTDRVLEEVGREIDPEQKERRKIRNSDLHTTILEEMEETLPDAVTYEELEDPDMIKTIEDTSPKELKDYSEKINRLKQEYFLKFLTDLEENLETPEQYAPCRRDWSRLTDIKKYGDDESSDKAVDLIDRVTDVVIETVDVKYTPDTEWNCLSSVECDVLNTLRPVDEDYSPTILALHWSLAEKSLDDLEAYLMNDPGVNYRIPFTKLRFFAKNDEVPEKVKDKAVDLIEKANEFVLNVIPLKYTEESDIDDLSTDEQFVLRHLLIPRNRYDPVVEALHWELMRKNFEEDLKKLRAGKKRLNEGLKKKLTFCKLNSRVPRHVKAIARTILDEFSPRRK